MNETLLPPEKDKEHLDAEKRVKKIKKFYKELASWAGTSVILLAIDWFLSGGISWSKYPVFFWGIAIAVQFINVLRIQRLDRQWEEKMLRKFKGQDQIPASTRSEPDYSEELLQNEKLREKEFADLSEYRKLKKPWKDEDLV
jgi:hypothetical protein